MKNTQITPFERELQHIDFQCKLLERALTPLRPIDYVINVLMSLAFIAFVVCFAVVKYMPIVLQWLMFVNLVLSLIAKSIKEKES